MENPKQEIIKMAAKLFEEKGYHKCSLEDIVEPLGITKGTFYYYFNSKEELLYYIHDEMITYVTAEIRKLPSSTVLTTEEKLYHIVRSLMVTIYHYKPYVAVFFQERKYLVSTDFYAKIKEKRDMFTDIVKTLLNDDYEKGKIRNDIDMKLIVFGILGMCNWAYQWYQVDGELDIVKIIRSFYEMLANGLIPKK